MRGFEKYEILYTEKEPKWQDAARRDVSFQRTQVYRCGDMLEIRSFPIWSTRAQKAAADQAVRERSDRQLINQRMRQKQRRDHFRRIMEANFDAHDMMITLTYNYTTWDYGVVDPADMERERAQFPQDIGEARRDVQRYIARLRYWMKSHDMDPKQLKYMYVTEEGKEQPDGNRLPWIQKFHHHVVLSGVSRETAESVWLGGFANSRRLQPNEAGLEQLANYLTKQKRFVHNWAHSKNLVIPQPETSDRAISRRRVSQIARDVQAAGREILEKIYPDYVAAEAPTVRFSEFVSGAYITARMRRRPKGGQRPCRTRSNT